MVGLLLVACGSAPGLQPTAQPSSTRRLVVMPADAAVYPDAARTATEVLRRQRVKGLDAPELSSVSIEVAQLSLECVEQTESCYVAVGKSLAANGLLFAQFDPGPQPDQVRVSVTLFDVDAAGLTKRARKLFDTEQDAVYGLREVVEEATRP